MGEESAKKMLNFDSFWTYNKKTKENIINPVRKVLF